MRGGALLRADRGHIWIDEGAEPDIDLVAHEQSLRSALSMAPGSQRDVALSEALANNGVLLEDEPYADWAIQPREALERLRQRARLELARDRSRGYGRCEPGAVVDAWEGCLAAEPTSEEAVFSLVRIYSARGGRQLALTVYERCRSALEAQGSTPSSSLDQFLRASAEVDPRPGRASASAPILRPSGNEERRLVTVFDAKLGLVAPAAGETELEDLKWAVGSAMAALVAEVEGLGGTVTSISGAGLVAIFGAPEAHEDDPERAVRAGARAISSAGDGTGRGLVSVSVGIETGPAVVGPLWSGVKADYVAVGEVVQAAAALQSAARASPVLVGPATRAATEGIFHWGPSEIVCVSPDTKPLTAAYLGRPRASTRSSDGPTCAPVPHVHGWPRPRGSSHGGGDEAGNIGEGLCRLHRW